MEEQVKVVNRRGGVAPVGTVVYIGRPSILGNPFSVDAHGRAGAVAQYHAWLRAQWRAGGPVRAALEALAARVRAGEQISLECWCAPLACHGDVIRKAVLALAAR